MSLGGCISKLNSGKKEVFTTEETIRIKHAARVLQKSGMDEHAAEKMAVQTELDTLYTEQKYLSDTIYQSPHGVQLRIAKALEKQALPERVYAIGAVKRGDITAEDVAEAHAIDTSNERVDESVKSVQINDFGEKISGARKEYAAAYKDKMAAAKEMDVLAQPLSKSWPEPDYQKLIDAGADKRVVGLVRSMRDEIPNKPGKSYRQSTWARQVELLRDTADKMLNDKAFADKYQAEFKKTEHLKLDDAINGRAELYELLGHEKSLKGIRISRSEYGVYNGIPYNPPKIIWEVTKDAKATAFGNMPKTLGSGDTRQAAIDSFQKAYSSLDTNKEKDNKTKFELYADRYAKAGDKGQFFIGKKVGRNVIHIKDGFDTVKEARAYISNNNEELTAILEKKKETPNERYDTNQPRAGQDMRNAQDVTQQMFSDAFGFRGVQFGNYVEGKRRQQDLNDAYDALMDLAAVLDIPPKAISLNGELGLAFGARGGGGKNAHAAHYERGQVVINLTKGSGAGSLAHEWWHGLDNYFSRQAGKKEDFATDRMDVSLSSRDASYMFKDDGIRKEMIDAFGAVVKAIRNTAIKERSRSLDNRRTKEYWGTGIEMSARSFERYVIAKLHDNGFSNDYLANVVSEEYWNAEDALGIGEGGSYPYPTESELPVIRDGFDKFFQAIESKETGAGVELFSKSTPTKNNHIVDSATTAMLDAHSGKTRAVLQAMLDTSMIKVVLAEQAAEVVGEGALYAKSNPKANRLARLITEEFLAENDAAFIHEISDSKVLEDILEEVANAEYHGEHNRIDERSESGANHRFVFTTPEGHTFYVFTTDAGRVWINVFDLEPGTRGQSIYAAVANYTYNTNKVFGGDPAGLTKLSMYRRTSNMLSSAVRFGTARHLDAAKEQIDGDIENGIEPLGWTGTDANRVESLIHSFVTTSNNRAPSLKDYKYDFQTGRFTDVQGRPISIAAVAEEIPRTAGIGEATARRAIFLKTLMDSSSQEVGERSGILEQIHRWGNSASPESLDRLFSKDRLSEGAKAQAFYNPADGITYFIADHIPKSYTAKEWEGLVLHEIATHALQLGKDSKEFQDILKQVESMRKAGNKAVVAAFKRVPADTKPENATEEALSYLLQHSPQLGIVQRVIAWLRNAIRAIGKSFPTLQKLKLHEWAASLNESDLRFMAESALRNSDERENGREAVNPRELASQTFSPLATVENNIKYKSAAVNIIARGDALFSKNPMSEAQRLRDRINYADERATRDPTEPTIKASPSHASIGPKEPKPVNMPQQPEDAGRALGFWMRFFTRNQIVSMYQNTIIGKQLKEYKRLREQITADTNKLFEVADDFLGDLRSMPVDLRTAFADLAHQATLHGVDPSSEKYVHGPDAIKMDAYIARNTTNKKLTEEAKAHLDGMEAAHARLRTMYLALPDTQFKKGVTARSLFDGLRQRYIDQTTLMFEAFEGRINRMDIDENIKESTIKELKSQLKTLLDRVYFPLYRSGDFILKARKVGQEEITEHHETERARNKHVKVLRAEGYTVDTSKRVVNSKNQKAVVAAGEIKKLIGKATAGGTLAGEELKLLLDEIDQTIIKSMPDTAYRRSFIHRKGTAGYSDDFIRAYASSMRRSSSHIASLRYGDQIPSAIDDMRKTVNNASRGSNTDALDDVVNRIVKIEEEILMPTGKFATAAGRIGFAQMLGSLSNFILNATQTYMITVPHLGAEYGYSKTALHLAKANAAQIAAMKLPKSLMELGQAIDMRSRLKGDELELFKRLHDSGKLDLGQVFDLIDAANNASENISDWKLSMMKFIGLPQHISEVVNRQVTALATIRLELARTNDTSKAYEAAKKAIDETHFDYSKDNRASIMTGDSARVVLMFKQYAQNYMFTWGNAAKLALAGSKTRDSDGNLLDGNRPSERKKARKQLAGLMATQFLAAGALGLPIFAQSAVVASGMVGFKAGGEKGAFVGVAAAMIAAMALAFGDGDDGEDFNTEMKLWFYKMFGSGWGDVLASGIIPRGVASRLDASQIIFRTPETAHDKQKYLIDWAKATAGAFWGGTVANDLQGSFEIMNGDPKEGAKKFIPVKQLKDMATAWQWAHDGMNVKNKDGEIVTAVSKADFFWKSIGVNPSSVVKAQEIDHAKRMLNEALIDKRKKVMDRLIREDDSRIKFNELILFNENAPPGYAIQSSEVSSRLKREALNKDKPADVSENPAREQYLNNELAGLRH